jgi:hypothetical protein
LTFESTADGFILARMNNRRLRRGFKDRRHQRVNSDQGKPDGDALKMYADVNRHALTAHFAL